MVFSSKEKNKADKTYQSLSKKWLGWNTIADAYMDRFLLVPRNDINNHYLHYYTGDDIRIWGLHDHPWWSISFLLKGKLEEIVFDPAHCHNSIRKESIDEVKKSGMGALLETAPFSYSYRTISVPRIKIRPPGYAHALQLKSEKAITYFVTGPRVQQWGFFTPWGWVAYDNIHKFSELAYNRFKEDCENDKYPSEVNNF